MVRRLLVLAAALSLGCNESTVVSPSQLPITLGYLKLTGGVNFEVIGAPTFEGKAVVPATFAVAILDSVGGPTILAFNQHEGTQTGDFFILHVNALRTGAFGPCADGPSTVNPDGSIYTVGGPCQVRYLQDATPNGMGLASRTFLSSVGGTVDVQSAGERLVGTVANLHLVATPREDSNATGVTIDTGEFDLPLVRGEQARVLTVCFAQIAVGESCTP